MCIGRLLQTLSPLMSPFSLFKGKKGYKLSVNVNNHKDNELFTGIA